MMVSIPQETDDPDATKVTVAPQETDDPDATKVTVAPQETDDPDATKAIGDPTAHPVPLETPANVPRLQGQT